MNLSREHLALLVAAQVEFVNALATLRAQAVSLDSGLTAVRAEELEQADCAAREILLGLREVENAFVSSVRGRIVAAGPLEPRLHLDPLEDDVDGDASEVRR